MRNAIPIDMYAKLVHTEKQWTPSERKKVRDAFLNNFVNAQVQYTGNSANINEIQIGTYYGRKVAYSAMKTADCALYIV
ncbi:MAG: hypothetical protein ACRC0A_05775 [Chitinophagaceae bacterium]